MTDINSTQEVEKKLPTIPSSQGQGSFLSKEHLTAVPHRFLLCLSFFPPSLHLIVTQPRKGLMVLNMYSIFVLKLDTQRKLFPSSQRKRKNTIPIEYPSLPAEIPLVEIPVRRSLCRNFLFPFIMCNKHFVVSEQDTNKTTSSHDVRVIPVRVP